MEWVDNKYVRYDGRIVAVVMDNGGGVWEPWRKNEVLPISLGEYTSELAAKRAVEAWWQKLGLSGAGTV